MADKKIKPSAEDLLQEINRKLGKILAVLATQGKDLETQIKILHDADLEWEEIGKYVGLTGEAARKRYVRKK